MKKAIALKWAKALRSKRYRQGTGLLSNDGEFCCLGVLCELYQADRKRQKRKTLSVHLVSIRSGKPPSCTEYDGEKELLPVAVQKWAGMKSHNGTMAKMPPSFEAFPEPSLSTANDAGYSFKDIALLIEANWSEL